MSFVSKQAAIFRYGSTIHNTESVDSDNLCQRESLLLKAMNKRSNNDCHSYCSDVVMNASLFPLLCSLQLIVYLKGK